MPDPDPEGKKDMDALAIDAARSEEGRGLATARAVLKVLAHLERHPKGVRAAEVAEVVNKSTSTAYYLLASLCEEGFAVREPHGGLYRIAPGHRGQPNVAEAPGSDELSAAVEGLFHRTHKRSYLARVEDGVIKIVAVRGRQGMPRIPGLGTRIIDSAHAVAIGKAVLAILPEEARLRYMQRGLRAFTPATITSPRDLIAELDRVRRQGYAVEREEFDEDFCCVAAPMLDASGHFRAVLGLSATRHAYDVEHDQLVEAVLAFSRWPRFQVPAENPGFLEQPDRDRLVLAGARRRHPKEEEQP
jgi:acetyl-CoA synthetase